MDSKKKPSGLPLKNSRACGIPKPICRAPLTNLNSMISEDLVNIKNINTMKINTTDNKTNSNFGFIHKKNLRRSRSATDLRSLSHQSNFGKKVNLSPLLESNIRTTKLTGAKATSHSAISNASTSTVTTTFNRSKLRRSRSVSDFKDIHQRPILARKPIAVNGPSKTIGSKVPSTQPEKPVAKPAARRIPPYDYKARYNDLLERHKLLKDKFENLHDLPALYDESQNLLEKAEGENKFLRTEVRQLKEQNQNQEKNIEQLTTSFNTTNSALILTKEKLKFYENGYKEYKNKFESIAEEHNELKERTEFLNNEFEIMKEQLFRANCERKELHNTIMDLRGNIRVFCRIRPPLESEEDRMLCKITTLDECSLEIANNDGKTRHEYAFDQVFHQQSGQESIFDMVSPLLQSALDGYNVCIFAYGQTGSGKTYTMDGVYENLGIIPRTVDLLFESVKSYKRLGWDYTIKASFLEIYNESLYDLLEPKQQDLEIRMVSARSKTEIYVSNLTQEFVSTGNELKELMNVARLNRATAATIGNERSSRSHAVTQITLTGTHEIKNEIVCGIINLVDLAGSESPKTSIRMDETKNINRSLSELTNVVLALIQKQDHIPYRNSKLTHLLMPSLGGNSKTLMFVNISPFQDCYTESIKSLRFAASVNSCKLSKAKKNKQLNSSYVNN